MNRRDTVLALIALGLPLRLTAQQANKAYQIGVLLGTPESSRHLVQAFLS